jgi:hypothetical protein
VALLIDNPTLPDVREFAQRRLFVSSKNLSISRAEHQKKVEPFLNFAAVLKEKYPALEVYDSANDLCDNSAGDCPVSENGNYYYSYSDHYSDYGGAKVARGLFKALGL